MKTESVMLLGLAAAAGVAAFVMLKNPAEASTDKARETLEAQIPTAEITGAAKAKTSDVLKESGYTRESVILVAFTNNNAAQVAILSEDGRTILVVTLLSGLKDYGYSI